MKRMLLIALLAAGFAPLSTNAQTAQEKAAEEKAWKAYAKPGPEHEKLGQEVGTWSTDMMFWEKEGARATKATSTCEVKMILGGRYQEMSYRGAIMGAPFEGISTLSFDNATKMYTNTWIDNMGTGMLVLKGKAAADGKSILFKGDVVNPVDGSVRPVRQVYTIVDADTRLMEMFDIKNGKEFKSMEITMRRN